MHGTSTQEAGDPVEKMTRYPDTPQFVKEDLMVDPIKSFGKVEQNQVNHLSLVIPVCDIVICDQKLVGD